MTQNRYGSSNFNFCALSQMYKFIKSGPWSTGVLYNLCCSQIDRVIWTHLQVYLVYRCQGQWKKHIDSIEAALTNVKQAASIDIHQPFLNDHYSSEYQSESFHL